MASRKLFRMVKDGTYPPPSPEEMRERLADEEDDALIPGGFDGH